MSTEETKQEKAEGTLQHPEDEDFAQMLEASEISGSGEALQPGERVKGEITDLSGEDAFVDVGGKFEGMIALEELQGENGEQSVQKGDIVEAYVVSNQNGQIRLSKSAQFQRGSDKRAALEEAFHARLPIEGTVTGRNKGGFEVTILGSRAFCPISQIEMGYAENLDQYLNQSYRFRITEFKEGGRSVVVSRAAVLREEADSKGEETLKDLKLDTILEGEVRSLRDFGAFVDIGGLEGLIHVSELAWGRVNHPKEVLEVGQKIKVKVIKIEEQPGKKFPRVGLSLRGLEDSPWERVGTEFREGEVYQGKVVRIANFGAFVELAPGLDGLVHISEMAWGRRINHPKDVVSVGQTVSVSIQSVDKAQKRISLSMKSAEEDPWDGIEERYAAGQQLTGRVEKVAPFGVFVSIENGVTALLPNSESNVREPAKEFPVGSEVTAQVLEVDSQRRRLTLSRKTMEAFEEEAEDVEIYRAAKQEFQGRRNRNRHGDKDKRNSYESDDDDGFGSLGDLIRSKNNRKRH